MYPFTVNLSGMYSVAYNMYVYHCSSTYLIISYPYPSEEFMCLDIRIQEYIYIYVDDRVPKVPALRGFGGSGVRNLHPGGHCFERTNP